MTATRPLVALVKGDDASLVRDAVRDTLRPLLLNKPADLIEQQTDKTSKMPSYKDKLTPSQLDDLTAYLSSLRSSESAQ